ncbi:GNAT family N-acetyltransferase [Microbacterium sp. ARD32]|uniref:GNAT family N-acetyltransferase n=1 Tax=Microbacterium sp. ARD32 TaxID=2962577 RepID=UPI0028826567|nr:GNAT family N-acetyltransferase [Microbacterium sp. ARD32]MDT0158206.1 GNAT family N-acetyltransferase [Microbacterium sp. ARD32]
MSLLLRPAEVGDADGIAEVHVRSWQQAYRGLMPQRVLDGLSVPERAASWARILDSTPRGSQTLVVLDGEQIVGWASFGAARDADAAGVAAGSGELWGIYAHPDAWSTGVGHLLLTAVERALADAGHASAYLWVLEGNSRASAFYERHGWHADGGRKVDERPGMVLQELRHVKRLV